MLLRPLPFLCTAAVAALAACQPAIDPVNREPAITAVDADRLFATDRARYSAADTAHLVLTNRLDDMLGYNLCVSVLERRIEDRWVTAPHQEERVCTLELRTLEPGATATFAWDLDPRLPSGTYRFRNHFELMTAGERAEFATNEFALEE
jgi:hypothetical protein